MAYVPPTPADFKAKFPQFSAVADLTVQGALDEAASRVDETWIERDFRLARMLFAAHVLTLTGVGTDKESKLAGLVASGLTSIKSGSLQVQLGALVGGAKKEALRGLDTTTYGQRFLDLLRFNHPAILVIDGH
jgi:hypothetical protein